MAETSLTKQIKRAIHSYKPKMPTKMRTVRYADEVWTSHGICDVVRAEDYVVSRENSCLLIAPQMLGKQWGNWITTTGYKLGQCKVDGEAFPNEHCRGCCFKSVFNNIGMAISAYEIKITKSDFYSEHGHSIDHADSPFANENYYCLPKELVNKVEADIPVHCGIIVWTGRGLRRHRPAQWLEVEESVKTEILYTMLKKWCDRVQD